MPVDTNNHIIPSRNGERGAMGGARKVFTLAKLGGNANRGEKKEIELLRVIIP